MTKNLTLLYVEDDQLVRENFIEIFQNYFTNIFSTDNGNKAFELYKTHKIDVAILDISIYGMNGLTLASKIREENKDTLILIISAYSDKEKLLQAINLNLIGYLVKPVMHKDLLETIHKITSHFEEDAILKISENFQWSTQSDTLFFREKTIKLTKHEIQIIKILLKNKNTFLNSCDIHDILFFEKEPPDKTCNNVTQLISRLKKKITKFTNRDESFIENHYGSGYKILIQK